MANSLVYHPFFTISLKDRSFHISINNLMRYTSLSLFLSRLLIQISLKLLYSTMCEKCVQFYGVHIRGKCIDSRHLYSCFSPLNPPPLPPHPSAFKFLSSHPRQKETSHSPRQHSFENLFPPTAERGGGNYVLPNEKSIRKY